MQEFLDLRTLSINNILISVSFASCLWIYSSHHSQFKGIRSVACAFFISSSAFLLMGLRSYIPDFLSILLPNILLVLSMSLIHCGFVSFYQLNNRIVQLFHGIMLLVMMVLATYFTYIDNNVNARIVLISFIVSLQCLYIMRTLFRVHHKANLAIALSFLLFAAFFALRGFLTLSEDSLTDFMAAGLIHSVSVFVYELIVVITSFGMVWIVSYKVQRVLAKQASHDPLTKVLNRRALEEIVNTEHSRSLRNGVPLSIIMLDIDHFKLINDRYGHGRGDDVLVEIANILVENTRQYDCIARFGGEEFIILLPNTSLNEANIIAEGLRLKIAEYEFDLNTEGCLKVTASFGVSEFDLLKDGWLNVLERADSGLYEAKETGRNKVIVFNSNNQDA